MNKTYTLTPEAYACIRAAYDFTVSGNGELYGAFEGWRIAGSHLITEHGDRIPKHLIESLVRELRFRGIKGRKLSMFPESHTATLLKFEAPRISVVSGPSVEG